MGSVPVGASDTFQKRTNTRFAHLHEACANEHDAEEADVLNEGEDTDEPAHLWEHNKCGQHFLL